MKNCTNNQKKILNLLLDKYEGSKTYQGDNQIQQSFYVSPEVIFPEYFSDYTNVTQIKDFEREMLELEEQKLIKVLCSEHVISKLKAEEHMWETYYELLGRKEKKLVALEQQDFFSLWEKKGIPIIQPFCQRQIKRLSEGKKPQYDLKTSENLFRLLEFMQKNQKDILERELSHLLLADSKLFKKSYQSKICKLICTFMDFEEKLQGIDDKKEREKIILEEFNIYENPSYVYIKGNCCLVMKDGREYSINHLPVAFSSELLKEIGRIQVTSNRIVTVENLTSFHRLNERDTMYLFLAGYHNSVKQAFLKRIYEENPKKQWFHFGDIDPDGYYILENLRKGTGIEFAAYKMGVEELKRYSKFCKDLEAQDRTKAENLLAKGKYSKVMKYLLDHNCKLEQEIISMPKWEESGNV